MNLCVKKLAGIELRKFKKKRGVGIKLENVRLFKFCPFPAKIYIY